MVQNNKRINSFVQNQEWNYETFFENLEKFIQLKNKIYNLHLSDAIAESVLKLTEYKFGPALIAIRPWVCQKKNRPNI